LEEKLGKEEDQVHVTMCTWHHPIGLFWFDKITHLLLPQPNTVTGGERETREITERRRRRTSHEQKNNVACSNTRVPLHPQLFVSLPLLHPLPLI